MSLTIVGLLAAATFLLWLEERIAEKKSNDTDDRS